MNKNTIVDKEKETNNAAKTEDKSKEVIDYKAKWEEARENLVIQHKESLEQIAIHTKRATKIEGTIEVNDQIFLEEEKSDS
jgi:hypothetical protein